MKKGQGLSMNTIIIAAIVIIVLIVLILIFTGRMNIFSGEVQSCSRQRGECKDDCKLGEYEVKGTDCGEEFRCCVSLVNRDGSNCRSIGGTCLASANVPEGSTLDFNGVEVVKRGKLDCPDEDICYAP